MYVYRSALTNLHILNVFGTQKNAIERKENQSYANVCRSVYMSIVLCIRVNTCVYVFGTHTERKEIRSFCVYVEVCTLVCDLDIAVFVWTLLTAQWSYLSMLSVRADRLLLVS